MYQNVNEDEFIEGSTALTVNGTILSLSSYVWRDFMPGQSDTSLRIVIYFLKDHNFAIYGDFQLEKLIVRHENQIWIPDSPVNRVLDKGTEIYVNGGPNWDIGAFIDISVQFKFNNDENLYTLNLYDQEIQKTW